MIFWGRAALEGCFTSWGTPLLICRVESGVARYHADLSAENSEFNSAATGTMGVVTTPIHAKRKAAEEQQSQKTDP